MNQQIEFDFFASGKDFYQQYLSSQRWLSVRKSKLRMAEYRCQVCSEKNKPLHVHHNNYSRLGKEKTSDLTVLCEDCHQLFHDHLKLKPLAA